MVGIWSAVEGVAILLAVNVAVNLHHPQLIPTAICLIVGLHFVPLTRGFGGPVYYVTGAVMSAVGLAGLAALLSPVAVCLAAAASLWLTPLWLTLAWISARTATA